MPKWLHRTTKQFLNSVASADLPEAQANYIEEPDLSAVTGQPNKYWEITGDVISLLDQTARDAVDDAVDTVQLDAVADELTRTRTIMRAFAEVVLDEINILRADMSPPGAPRTLAQLRNAVRSKL